MGNRDVLSEWSFVKIARDQLDRIGWLCAAADQAKPDRFSQIGDVISTAVDAVDDIGNGSIALLLHLDNPRYSEAKGIDPIAPLRLQRPLIVHAD